MYSKLLLALASVNVKPPHKEEFLNNIPSDPQIREFVTNFKYIRFKLRYQCTFVNVLYITSKLTNVTYY